MADHLSSVTGDSRETTAAAAYIEELIRRDMEEIEAVTLANSDELRRAFATPDSEAVPFDRDAFFDRMRQRHGL